MSEFRQTIYRSTATKPDLQTVASVADGVWMHLQSPRAEDLHAFAKKYKFDPHLLLDGIDPNESPRIEREAGSTYIYTRYSLPEEERLTTAPLLIIYTPDMVVTVARRDFDLAGLMAERGIQIITSKRAQFVLAMLSFINLGYKQRINDVSRRIWDLRSKLNRAHIDNQEFLKILDLEEDLNDILWVLEPMYGVLDTLLNGRFMRLYEDDRDLIEDLSLSAKELTQLANSRLNALRNIRDAYNTIATNNLNKIFRMLTSVAILIAVATMFTSLYGMNVKLPFAENDQAFWFVIGGVITSITVISIIFQRKRWL